MAKYRKKPVVIEAEQWFKLGDIEGIIPYIPLSQRNCSQCEKDINKHGWILTLDGKGGHIVCPNDWIITGAMGKKTICKPKLFADSYEKVGE